MAVKHFSAALVVEWWMTLHSQLWKCCHNIVTDRLSCGCTERCGERGAISGCWLAAFFEPSEKVRDWSVQRGSGAEMKRGREEERRGGGGGGERSRCRICRSLALSHTESESGSHRRPRYRYRDARDRCPDRRRRMSGWVCVASVRCVSDWRGGWQWQEDVQWSWWRWGCSHECLLLVTSHCLTKSRMFRLSSFL